MPLRPLQKFTLIRVANAALIIAIIGWDIAVHPSAVDFVWICRAAALAYAGWLLLRVAVVHRRVRAARQKATTNIAALRAKVFGDGLHRYRNTRLEDVPHLDRGFYEMSKSWFESNGFRHIGDLEDVTLSEANPKSRSILRLFLDESGTLQACVYQAFLPSRGGMMRVLRRVEIGSDLSNATALTTFNGLAPTTTYPFERVVSLPVNSPPADLVESHRKTLDTFLAEHPDVTPVAYRDVEDLIQALHRSHARKVHYKQTVIWPNELPPGSGRPRTARETAFVADLAKLDAANPPKS